MGIMAPWEAGKLLLRTDEICSSADALPFCIFYMKLSCYSRKCRKRLISEGFACVCALIKMTSYLRRCSTWRDISSEMLSHCLHHAKLRPHYFGNYMTLSCTISEVEKDVRFQKTSYAWLYGFKLVAILPYKYFTVIKMGTTSNIQMCCNA